MVQAPKQTPLPGPATVDGPLRRLSRKEATARRHRNMGTKATGPGARNPRAGFVGPASRTHTRTKEDSMPAAAELISTPWGVPDLITERAPGITVYSTPRHGGIYLSRARRQEMPQALREVETFAGGNWYEEDCDSALVILSFPGTFGPYAVWEAAKTLKHMSAATNGYDRYRGVWDKWQGPEKEKVEAIAREYEQQQGGQWQAGSCWTDGYGWRVSYTQIGTGTQAWRHLTPDEYMNTPQVVAELPGRPVE